MNEFYLSKASIPRDVRTATNLRDALRSYIDKRLLHVADACLQNDHDLFRKEFGLIHKRYANTLSIVTEAVQDVNYLTKSVVVWIQEDFENALTGAQKDAAALCATELMKIIEQYDEPR
jgi:hypothetical protein